MHWAGRGGGWLRGALGFMVNERYGDAVAELLEVAKTNRRATSDPAFRLLQILTRVKTSTGTLTL